MSRARAPVLSPPYFRYFSSVDPLCIYIYKVVAFVCVCVCLCVQLSYSPHHWADHDQTWHDDGPPPRDGAHHFSRSRSKVKVIAYVYILSYSPHHWTDHDQTWHDDGPPPRDGAHHFPR